MRMMTMAVAFPMGECGQMGGPNRSDWESTPPLYNRQPIHPPAHRKLTSLASVNLWIPRMQRVIPSGNSRPNVYRRPSPYAGYNIAISGMIGLGTGIARDSRSAVAN